MSNNEFESGRPRNPTWKDTSRGRERSRNSPCGDPTRQDRDRVDAQVDPTTSRKCTQSAAGESSRQARGNRGKAHDDLTGGSGKIRRGDGGMESRMPGHGPTGVGVTRSRRTDDRAATVRVANRDPIEDRAAAGRSAADAKPIHGNLVEGRTAAGGAMKSRKTTGRSVKSGISCADQAGPSASARKPVDADDADDVDNLMNLVASGGWTDDAFRSVFYRRENEPQIATRLRQRSRQYQRQGKPERAETLGAVLDFLDGKVTVCLLPGNWPMVISSYIERELPYLLEPGKGIYTGLLYHLRYTPCQNNPTRQTNALEAQHARCAWRARQAAKAVDMDVDMDEAADAEGAPAPAPAAIIPPHPGNAFASTVGSGPVLEIAPLDLGRGLSDNSIIQASGLGPVEIGGVPTRAAAHVTNHRGQGRTRTALSSGIGPRSGIGGSHALASGSRSGDVGTGGAEAEGGAGPGPGRGRGGREGGRRA